MMKMQTKCLWKSVQLKDIAKLIRGVSYPKNDAKVEKQKGFVGIYRANNIQNGFLNEEDLVYVPSANIAVEQIVKKHDIVLAMSSGSKHLVGKTAQTLADSEHAFGAFCGLIRPTSFIEPRFLGYFFETPGYRRFIADVSMGVNINNLRRDHVESLSIPICSLPEQKRIVAKIESLFSRLDSAKDSLERVRQEIKRYRQSVLKAAFEGKLTNSSFKDWRRYALRDLGLWQGGGTPSKRINAYWHKARILWVSPKDMKVWKINDSIDKITEKAVEESTANMIKAGSILVVVRSGILSHTLPVAILMKDATVNQDLKALTLHKGFDSEFVAWQLRSCADDILHKCSKTGTTVSSVEFEALKEYNFNVPGFDEQKKIVKAIVSRFDQIGVIENTVEQGLKKIEQLKQSILKKAFEGKLVESDPNDEPVEVLLERIKKEKARLR